jgi:hypothetical protein
MIALVETPSKVQGSARMIDKLTGEVQLAPTLTVGPTFDLVTLQASPDFYRWTVWPYYTEHISVYQRELLDCSGHSVVVVLFFFGQQLDGLLFSFSVAEEPDNPMHIVERQVAYHEQWLRNELGDCPYECAWGWVGEGGSPPPGPDTGLAVRYHR